MDHDQVVKCVHSRQGTEHGRIPNALTSPNCWSSARKHILLECPRYADARRITLARVATPPTVNDILGTQDGIHALAKFIAKTGAFSKTGDACVADPHETVYEPKSTRTRRRTRRNAALGNRRIHEGC